MVLGLNPEPNFWRPASSGDQAFGCLQPINSIPVSKVDANLLGCEFLPTSQSFARKLLVPDYGSLPKVTTCNTGSLDGKISNPINDEFLGPAPTQSDTCPANLPYTIATNDNLPAPDAGNFPKILTHDTDRLLGKISKSTNENCPEPAQIPGNGVVPAYLPNTNYQVVKQKRLKAYSAEIANSNPPVPDFTLPKLKKPD
ncbi:hypothetical protein DSO57_1004164 [Entomophthora muscae]|uniref:Uncharacterized protein n=1 Tax=Entomophthora muscae TaxID=34485 RepID=A0ACC2UIX2_9FUNG|nr:hypothetical protein DSO57_1004164 [Entomophthora muscae]